MNLAVRHRSDRVLLEIVQQAITPSLHNLPI